jgi:glycosyltransferase involved in cell wall biosynthesis
VKVLIVNHTAIKSGAEVSLLDLVLGMPEEISSVVACPEGELTEELYGLGVPVLTIPEIDASFRVHPIQTLRGAAQIIRSALAVRRAAKVARADLIHANSVRAGLAAGGATRLGGPPVIVHVRDCLPESRAADLTRRLILATASQVLAISRYTAASFGHGRTDDGVRILHDAVDLDRFDPKRLDRSQARDRLSIGADVFLLGVVGQITPWKGQATAIQALALLTERVPNVRLLVVGSVKFSGKATRYDNVSYLRSLRQMVDELQLHHEVAFLGDRQDVPELLRAMDLLLVPSWEEPFGRTVIEAMAMETPVLATSIGGPAEVIDDRVNGRLLPPRQAQAWARVIEELMAAPEVRKEIAGNGRRTAMSFGRSAHAQRIADVYREILATSAGG